MKKDIAMKWVKALRSGKFEQAKHALKSGEGYCCLGVLQECVLGMEIPDGGEELSDRAAAEAGMSKTYFDDYRTTGSLCGDETVKIKGVEYGSLADANDGSVGPRCTFPTIADWIEKNWERL